MALVNVRLSDAEWARIAPLLPERERRRTGPRGGRPYADPRAVLEGVLWVLVTGARWKDLPDCYPPHQTCHRRFLAWCRDGLFERLLRELLAEADHAGLVRLDECFVDGTFVGARKGGPRSDRPSAARAAS